MHLVIFDIDGTLTHTVAVDEECFVRALAEVFGFANVDTDWSRYEHATDSGIIAEIHKARTGRSPRPADVARFRRHFVRLLRQASSECPFAAIPGARELLRRLADGDEYRVALATGAWSDSARLKMAGAGLCFDDYPATSSDDVLDRESIIKLAIKRATKRYGRFVSVVYVGDGIWDARACRNVGIPFIGIGTGNCAERLVAEGAACVFGDLSETDLFCNKLSELMAVPSIEIFK